MFDGDNDRMHAAAKAESYQPGLVNGRSIAILCISPVRALDLIGPGEVFMEANRLKGHPFYQLTFLSGAEIRLFSVPSPSPSILVAVTWMPTLHSTRYWWLVEVALRDRHTTQLC
jgi:hypothetical protein